MKQKERRFKSNRTGQFNVVVQQRNQAHAESNERESSNETATDRSNFKARAHRRSQHARYVESSRKSEWR